MVRDLWLLMWSSASALVTIEVRLVSSARLATTGPRLAPTWAPVYHASVTARQKPATPILGLAS